MFDKIIRRPEVEDCTGLSRSTIYSMMDPKSPYHDPTFPKPVKLGKRAVGWSQSAIVAWVGSRTQGRV